MRDRHGCHRTRLVRPSAWLVLLANLCAPGCSSVTLQTLDGSVERSFIGFVHVRGAPLQGVAPSPGTGVNELSMAGLAIHKGFTLGWSRERVITIPLDCKAVILLEAGATVPDSLQEAIRNHSLCVASP